MKHLRLIALVLAVSACFASLVIAGGRSKGAKASGAGDCCGEKSATTAATGSASMSCPAGSAQCTAAQREACAKAAKTTDAAKMGTCPMHGTAAAAAGSCAMHGTAAAAAGTCAMHGTTASAAGSCGMKGSSAAAASGCKMHGAAAAGGKCDMSAMAANCIVCADEAACDEEMRSLNSHAQVVELRNGAMIVYTADTPENVRALQAALARHNEQVMNALAANSETNLCNGCKTFRGAMASGKFTRELVNLKGGAQVLLTSNDRDIVRRIHELAGTPSAKTKT